MLGNMAWGVKLILLAFSKGQQTLKDVSNNKSICWSTEHYSLH